MADHGESAETSREMFDDSVGSVIVATSLVAVVVAVGVASVLGARWLAHRSREVGAAARRDRRRRLRGRVPREGPERDRRASPTRSTRWPIALEEQERLRRDFIANAAHELRTPLTNLQGYLEALRDGVIAADRATFESLLGGGRAARPAVALARHPRRGRRGRAAPRRRRTSTSRRRPVSARARAAGVRRAGLSSSVDVAGMRCPRAATPTSSPRSLGEPAPERGPLHAGRRPGHRVRAERGRPTSSCGRRTPARASRPRTCRTCSSASIASRSRATGPAAAPGIGLAIVRQLVEGGGGRVGAESGDGHDALLVQPARAERAASAGRLGPLLADQRAKKRRNGRFLATSFAAWSDSRTNR